MDQEKFLWLAVKVLSGEQTAEEAALLKELVATDPAYAQLYDLFSRYWSSENRHPNQPANVEEALQGTWAKIRQTEVVVGPARRNRRLYRRLVAVAAAITVLLVGGWMLKLTLNAGKPAVALLEKYNPKGSRSDIILADGTKIWLNADSRLRYPPRFASGQREVWLEGEAFFEIAGDATRPFMVHLHNGDVKVLGTSFNVKAYPEDGKLETSVLTGKVAFMPQTGVDTLLLTTNRRATFIPGTGDVWVTDTDAAADRAWINGVIRFNAASLEEIARLLDRHYGKQVRFNNEAVKHYRYTGTFDNNTEEDILRLLSRIKAFNYSITDSLVLIGNGR